MVAHKAAYHTLSKAFLINEDMVQTLLIFEVLVTLASKVGGLFCCAPSCFKPSLFFSNYLLGLVFKPVQDDFQHECSRMTDEADSSVVPYVYSIIHVMVRNNWTNC